jgi:membrane-associated phospholipid phosphatase
VSSPEPAVELATPSGTAWGATESRSRAAGWRLVSAGPLIAVFTLIVALAATGAAGVTFRDPDNVAALYILEVGAGVALLVGLDIFLRARRRTGVRWPSRAAMGAVRRERWTAGRTVAVATALVSFYVTYLAYRNLKAVVPLLRPEDLFDVQLADIDRVMFLGNDPAALLHGLFGTGVAAHVISALYIAFIVFLPLSLGVALVFAERLKASLFYAAALSLNWILGAATYFLLPALGPIYFFPQWFADLPYTEVTFLQDLLMSDRVAFLADPATGTPQAIAAFVSLHIAMSFTALLAAYLFDLGRRLKQALWAWMAVTTIATVYLGWHYFIDDIAALLVAVAALALARVITGFDPRSERTAET